MAPAGELRGLGYPRPWQRDDGLVAVGETEADACLFLDEFAQVDVADPGAPYAASAMAPYAAEAAALLRFEVDAIYVAGDAGRALARRIGAVEVVDLGSHLDPAVRVNAMTPVALTVGEELLEREPERVVRELAAHPATIDLSQQALDALGAQQEWLLTHGFLADDVDVAEWVERGPLDAARSLRSARF